MPDLPNFQDLYDEFEAATKGSNSSRLNDFSEGSFLDAFAALAATAARSIDRWILKQIQRSFLQTADEGDLETVAVDYYGDELQRRDGESFEAYRTRVLEYRDNGLARGTVPALRYYGQEIDGVQFVDIEELPKLDMGALKVKVYFDPDETSESEVREAWKADLDAWRAVTTPIYLQVFEASDLENADDTDIDTNLQVV